MALIDEITFHIRAGHGGSGVVRWRHERGKELSGPSGGNGGKGGDVYLRAIRDLGALARYRNTKEWEAGKGEDGMRDSMHGKDGDDLILDVPVGSVVTDHRTGRKISLLNDGEVVKILLGGRGGQGNEYFKSSVNTSPKENTPGLPGEEADFTVELELFADAGLIGFPNAGKSSLLNALTNASAKVGSYAFTTLEPNLGAMFGYIIADIPGLIEGASEGKGLGHRFLRHIKRTKRLFHLISLENDDVVAAWKTVRNELDAYGAEHGEDDSSARLSDKPETIILTKTDMVESGRVAEAVKELAKSNKDILTVTVLDDTSVKALQDEMVKRVRVESGDIIDI